MGVWGIPDTDQILGKAEREVHFPVTAMPLNQVRGFKIPALLCTDEMQLEPDTLCTPLNARQIPVPWSDPGTLVSLP
jgi:hypothetical protein